MPGNHRLGELGRLNQFSRKKYPKVKYIVNTDVQFRRKKKAEKGCDIIRETWKMELR